MKDGSAATKLRRRSLSGTARSSSALPKASTRSTSAGRQTTLCLTFRIMTRLSLPTSIRTKQLLCRRSPTKISSSRSPTANNSLSKTTRIGRPPSTSRTAMFNTTTAIWAFGAILRTKLPTMRFTSPSRHRKNLKRRQRLRRTSWLSRSLLTKPVSKLSPTQPITPKQRCSP